jgi:anaerobic magnesium-protoporphyrin IX monomethyl ester cyclase
MNILFLIPSREFNQKKLSIDRVYGCNYGYDYKPAIHLLICATIADKLGHSVRFMDCPAENINIRAFLNYIKNNKIDIVIFFSVWLSFKEDLLSAKIISDNVHPVKIVFMGAYPTWKPEIFLKDNNYFVIRGEPEETLREFLYFIESNKDDFDKIQGMSFLRDNQIINNPARELIDINLLPVPDRKLLKGRYFFNRIDEYPSTVMCVSRGCSYNCTYCAPQALDQAIEIEYYKCNLKKPPLRLRTVEKIIDEFEEISSLGYKGIEICDNQFPWDKERTVRICEAIKPLKLKWICYARADHANDKYMLRLMKEAGCKLIYIGTESFKQEILDNVNKQINVSESYAAVKYIKEAGIEAEVSVLLGASPLETKESIYESIHKARIMKTRFVHYSVALPIPNTQFYRNSREKGWLKNNEFTPTDNMRGAIVDLPNIKAQDLKKIIRRCYLRQYLSVNFLVGQLFNFKSLRGFRHKVKAFLKFLRYLCSIN